VGCTAQGARVGTGENPPGADCPKRYDEPQFGKYGHVRSNRSLKGYAGKAGAKAKSVTLNAGNAGRYGYAGKVAATFKSPIPSWELTGDRVDFAREEITG